MRLVIPVEARMMSAPDGSVWVKSPSNYGFYSRYLAGGFDSIRVLARMEFVPDRPRVANRVDGPGVSVGELPYYVGPRGFLSNYPSIRRELAEELSHADAVLLRMPSQLAAVTSRLVPRGMPLGLEIVGDPHAVFAPGVMSHPLRRFFRTTFTRQLRRMAACADSVAYVTQEPLRHLYPPSTTAFTSVYSSVDLDIDAFGEPRMRAPGRYVKMVTVGSLDQEYKGVGTVIRSIGDLADHDIDASLTVVGGGRLVGQYRQLARELGVESRVTFTGQVSAGAEVRHHLDAADVFVLASQTEGLPRAMIEAMARGLPCCGTPVGGVPDLLPSSRLFAPGDHRGLAAIVAELSREHTYVADSRERLEASRQYSKRVLAPRRDTHYRYLYRLAQRRGRA